MSSVAADGDRHCPGALSASEACAAQRDFAGLQVDRYGLYWVEYCPDDGHNRVIGYRQGKRQALTPEGFSARSRVHEYGGGAFCLANDRLVFVNDSDQQLWLQPLLTNAREDSHAPLRLTETPDTRYGDLLYDPHRRRVIAVAEQHGADGVENRLIAVSLRSGRVQVLAQGHDFYSSPCLSPDGHQLTWLAWDHPHQPWTRTRLYRTSLDRQGECLAPPQLMAGGDHDESLFQPGFDSGGRLHVVSDRSGWWNLYRLECNGHWQNLCPMAAEFGVAQWQLGLSTWAMLANGQYGCSLVDRGQGRLLSVRCGTAPLELATEFSQFRSLCSDGERLYCIANAPDRSVAILSIDPQSGAHRVLAGGERPAIPISLPEPFKCPVASDEQVQGFFYPPSQAGDPMKRGVPPLLVMTHGGPTATSYPVYRPMLQYWSGRGFAVLDLNYRGSAGYGRDYRHRLAGNWGQTDVEDVAAAIEALTRRGRIDRHRVFIRGNSAGGYTTLNALARLEGLCAGASLYGVSDPLSLTRVTHKFESHYLNWLIGDPKRDIARYRERSPLRRAGAINTPVIFFQGREDRVVLPDQTLRMVEALRAHGTPTELHLFDDEGHGFRKASNQVRLLEQELAFYQRFLSASGKSA